MSNNDMINGYDQVQDDDLTWLARNRHEWEDGKDSAILTSDRLIVAFVNRDNAPAYYTGPVIARDQWQQRRAELQNKPSWDDAPDWAEYLAQDSDGKWYWYEKELEKLSSKCSMWNGTKTIRECNYELASTGEVLGDWRNTLEQRLEKRELNPPTSSLHHSQAVEIAKETGLCCDGRPCGEVHEFYQDAYCSDCPNDPCNCDGCTDGDEEIPPPQYDPKDVAFAPSKYHRKINGKWCDVYDILQTWNVTNPALQHLIKKALQAGNRGHKDLETDMQDIIDSAVRAKELARIG